MTDFGADEAFAAAAAKVKEHYGVEVPVSAVRGFTEEHGAAMLGQEKRKSDWPEGADLPGVPVLIAEMDGSMLPVVETDEAGAGEAAMERRKRREVGGKEARLAMAQVPGAVLDRLGEVIGSGGVAIQLRQVLNV